MRLHRFFVSQPLGEVVVVEEFEKINQWRRVFKYKKGDLVVLFNGDEKDKTYLIENLSTKDSTLRKISEEKTLPVKKDVALYLSILKKDNFELAVQKATELGCKEIIPIISERTEKKGLNLSRLKKVVKEAMEQSGNGRITQIKEIMGLEEALKNKKDDLAIVLQINKEKISSLKIKNMIEKSKKISVFIGPEGGWGTEDENLFQKNKVVPISLGNSILRSETAVIASLSFLLI